MTEEEWEGGDTPHQAPPHTGVAGVDDVLAEVADALRGPVDEQVPAVARAHDQLRRALDDTP